MSAESITKGPRGKAHEVLDLFVTNSSVAYFASSTFRGKRFYLLLLMVIVLDQSFLHEDGQDIGGRLAVTFLVTSVILLGGDGIVTQEMLGTSSS